MRSVIWLAVLVVCGSMSVGCGGGDTPTPAAQTASSSKPAASTQTASAPNPVSKVAERFLTAVVKGDTLEATACLTPAAIAQLQARDEAFASPQLGAPNFTVGEVRDLGDGRAAVQCLLQDEAGEAEMLCLVKQVSDGWRVSGVVYEVAADQPPVIVNFEELDSPTSPPQQRSDGYFVGPGGATPQSPANRTAAQPGDGSLR